MPNKLHHAPTQCYTEYCRTSNLLREIFNKEEDLGPSEVNYTSLTQSNLPCCSKAALRGIIKEEETNCNDGFYS